MTRNTIPFTYVLFFVIDTMLMKFLSTKDKDGCEVGLFVGLADGIAVGRAVGREDG